LSVFSVRSGKDKNVIRVDKDAKIHYKFGMSLDEKGLLFNRDTISKRVEELADIISVDYSRSDLIMIGVLKGAFIFLADLVRSVKAPVKVDFVHLASYGAGTQSSGHVGIIKDIEMPIKGKDVLVVEDIVDSGITLSFLMERLRSQHPSSLKCCALIDKKERREVDLEVAYVGFPLDSGFVVGYGLDANENYRYLPDIYVINP
jgi:hypoxanthine phosphoribosyltransferase